MENVGRERDRETAQCWQRGGGEGKVVFIRYLCYNGELGGGGGWE